jgi:H+/Cl- antiporter ClcA
MVAGETPAHDPAAVMRSREFLGLLVLAAVVGVVASLAAWCFLEAINAVQDGVYDHLPGTLGFDHTPVWWPLPVLFVGGVGAALAIWRHPGRGGHIPANGLNPDPITPIQLPGVILAAIASISLGAVVGPEAPLIALGGGIGLLAIGRLRSGAPPETATLVAACGTFAALSFLFGSPVIAAVLLIEATGLGGPRLTMLLIPGLLAAGIGSLVSIGLGAWTGVNSSAISLELLPVDKFVRPDLTDFLWTVPLAAAIALGTVLIFAVARPTARIVEARPFALPFVGLAVAALASGFAETTDKGTDQVLFSGQDALGPLVSSADTWSLSALALLIAFKGVGYAISLGSFRGGPAFPAIFLGAAAGLMAAQLPGFELTPAVAVGIGAAVVAVLRLPLSSIVLALLLTSHGGLAISPLVIVGVVVAYLVANKVAPPPDPIPAGGGTVAPA